MFTAFTQQHCDALLSIRANETKLGQQVLLANPKLNLAENAQLAANAARVWHHSHC
ncbi:hypothetical protein O1D97_02570 [Marinomonas sp. 15G1-11]|uniref:Uncharacterized protein n=1 Tax=Marinomonas phaeophyticola TaxID=3004091 RepID=A0ABT4JQF4_9GAMM|nr:hypothetical protein [Marinomonas sp. 15G1-11]MCZ2720559.1 hypothetical protein [Marinomonas sp. 15G1-11]